jgi:hypothetical protein
LNGISTRTASFYLDENDILIVSVHPGIRIDYEDATDNALVVKNLTRGLPVLKLVDSTKPWTIDKKAAKLVASKEVREKTIARAVVKSSALSALILNFFTGLTTPKVPTRVFSDYDEAYEWLLSYRKKKGSIAKR